MAQAKHWIVRYDGCTEDAYNVKSSNLKEVKDERKLVWYFNEDSVPDNPVRENSKIGVVGFDYKTNFAKTELEMENDDYKYPYLLLFQHLWPGKRLLPKNAGTFDLCN